MAKKLVEPRPLITTSIQPGIKVRLVDSLAPFFLTLKEFRLQVNKGFTLKLAVYDKDPGKDDKLGTHLVDTMNIVPGTPSSGISSHPWFRHYLCS